MSNEFVRFPPIVEGQRKKIAPTAVPAPVPVKPPAAVPTPAPVQGRPSNQEIVGNIDGLPIQRQVINDYIDYRGRKDGKKYPSYDTLSIDPKFDLTPKFTGANGPFNIEYVKNRQKYYNQGLIPIPGGAVVEAPQQEVVKGTGEAKKELLPIPKAVVAKAVNHNTEEFERDSGGKLTNIKKASTVDSAFSLGKRTQGAFNIGRFRAEVSSADSVLPTHSFLVVFAPMPWAIQRYPQAGNLDSILTMRCDNVVLPSINLLQEQNIRRYGFGPVENVAYGVNVGDFTLQFIVDKKAHVVGFFEAWLNRIVNRYSYGGADMNTEDSTGRTPYEIAYKDTYACSSVNVFMYDRSQNNVLEYNIYDVFPTGIQSMNMSWSEENTLMKLNVTFSFTDLRIQQSPEKDKSGVGFGSTVDERKKALLKALENDAQIRAGDFSGTARTAPSDRTPGAVKISGDGDDGAQFNSVIPVQQDTWVARIELEGRPRQLDALGNVITQS